MLAIQASLMRGGTSKGLYFVKQDLPQNIAERDAILLAAMGSPDARQIDGVGGAHPLTSKVAIVSLSDDPLADVDYLFLQVSVDQALVSDAQNCGNLLAGVGPFAIEQGLVPATKDTTDVRIKMVNTNTYAVARVETPNSVVNYAGDARIDGVPNSAAPVMIEFLDVAGSSCGTLFPTGNSSDLIEGVEVTCIDNGMPVVLLDAKDFCLSGNETVAELEANTELKSRVEKIRLAAAHKMNLGDVTNKTVPKMSLISPAVNGGHINTRTFIPHRVHEAIGVLGSVSVATACVVEGTVAHKVMQQQADTAQQTSQELSLQVEHPTGAFVVEMQVESPNQFSKFRVVRAALLRTARLLMRGEIFVDNNHFTD